MPTSQNGWPCDPPRSKRKVPGTDVSLVVADGPAGDVLMYVAEQFNRRVEKLEGADNGGYNPRHIGTTRTPSNHWSATAIDLEWNDHQYLRRNTFSKSQVAELRLILSEVDNVVGWGGDYRSADEMHFEIRRPYAAVKVVADRLRDNTLNRTLREGDAGEDVKHLQGWLNDHVPGSDLVEDGRFGRRTATVVREFQSSAGLTVDAIVGPKTWAKMGY